MSASTSPGARPPEPGQPLATRHLSGALDATETLILTADCRGYDPYDALLSPLWSWPGLSRWRFGQWAFQQVLRRVPWQTRPLFGIRPGRNPVTLGLVLQGLADRCRAAGSISDERATLAADLVRDLETARTPG